jgi:hypothetical protein
MLDEDLCVHTKWLTHSIQSRFDAEGDECRLKAYGSIKGTFQILEPERKFSNLLGMIGQCLVEHPSYE